MTAADLYNALSDSDNKEQIADILWQTFDEYFKTDRYYEAFNPVTRRKEGCCETVNIAELLLRICDALERIADRL